MIAVTFFFTTALALSLHGGWCFGDEPAPGRDVKTAEHENSFFRDFIGYSIGTLGIHRLGLFVALSAGFWSAVCIIISGPFWTRGWPEWWGWWLNLPIWRRGRIDPWPNTRTSSPGCRWGPAYPGVPLGRDSVARQGKPGSHWLGRLGDAQIGPLYLGMTGLRVGDLRLHRLRDHRPGDARQRQLGSVQFVRQLLLAGARAAGARNTACAFPPLNEGGWWIIAGFFLSLSVILWWVRTYRRARALGMGTHVPWAFAAALWLFFVLGFFRPLAMGSCARRCPSASSRTSTGPRRCRSATATCSTTRSTRSASSSSMARPCCSPCNTMIEAAT